MSSPSSSPQSLSATYRSSSEAARAVDRLLESGVRSQGISVWLPERTRDHAISLHKRTQAASGAGLGGSVGGALGGLVAWVAAAGLLAIPGLGWLTAAGPLVAALAGAGGLGLLGGMLGAVVGVTRTEYRARRVEHALDEGAVVVGVTLSQGEPTEPVEEVLGLCRGLGTGAAAARPSSPNQS